jgi:hypothetical protein
MGATLAKRFFLAAACVRSVCPCIVTIMKQDCFRESDIKIWPFLGAASLTTLEPEICICWQGGERGKARPPKRLLNVVGQCL